MPVCQPLVADAQRRKALPRCGAVAFPSGLHMWGGRRPKPCCPETRYQSGIQLAGTLQACFLRSILSGSNTTAWCRSMLCMFCVSSRASPRLKPLSARCRKAPLHSVPTPCPVCPRRCHTGRCQPSAGGSNGQQQHARDCELPSTQSSNCRSQCTSPCPLPLRQQLVAIVTLSRLPLQLRTCAKPVLKVITRPCLSPLTSPQLARPIPSCAPSSPQACSQHRSQARVSRHRRTRLPMPLLGPSNPRSWLLGDGTSRKRTPEPKSPTPSPAHRLSFPPTASSSPSPVPKPIMPSRALAPYGTGAQRPHATQPHNAPPSPPVPSGQLTRWCPPGFPPPPAPSAPAAP